MSVNNWFFEMFRILEHFSESCLDKIKYSLYEDNESMFDVFFIFRDEKIIKYLIIYVKNFFYNTEHNP